MKKLKQYKYERYAILCQLAYPSGYQADVDFSEFEQVEIFDRFNTSCVRIVWQESRREVVVFRGSHNIYDWLLNLCCFKSKVVDDNRKFYVHWGVRSLLKQPSSLSFQKSTTRSLQQNVQAVLKPLVEQGKKITFVGHSTGGSLAVLCADLLNQQTQIKIKRIVTFGQPACGGNSFYKAYSLHNKTYRICCDVDMVTLLPPLPYIYRHVGRQLWLHEGVIYENIKPLKRFLISLKDWLFRPITFHYMDKYIRSKELFDKH
ncbi:MAG: DUF2974 domain-containing protein [Gammaproteobacteria bacterium]|nr:DUF2974 domain-containing protein [Gammaproteobacteria bacterium]